MKIIEYTNDYEDGLIYVQLTDNDIKRTKEYDEETYIDLDENKSIVGIEFLKHLSDKEVLELTKITLIELGEDRDIVSKLILPLDKPPHS